MKAYFNDVFNIKADKQAVYQRKQNILPFKLMLRLD